MSSPALHVCVAPVKVMCCIFLFKFEVSVSFDAAWIAFGGFPLQVSLLKACELHKECILFREWVGGKKPIKLLPFHSEINPKTHCMMMFNRRLHNCSSFWVSAWILVLLGLKCIQLVYSVAAQEKIIKLLLTNFCIINIIKWKISKNK